MEGQKRAGEWQKRAGAAQAVVMAVLGLWGFASPAYATGVKPAVAVVTQFQHTLLLAMKKGKALGFQGRYRMLAPAVHKSHDLTFIAQVTVGPYWSHLSASARHAFVHRFTQLTIATYASEFRRYSGEDFHETAAHVVGRGDVLVETKLVAHGHKEATIDYLVAPVGPRWEIVNIVANGVSDLALKRAQYTAIIQKKGFPALLALLKAKVAQLSKARTAR